MKRFYILTSAKSSKQLPANGWGLLSSVISTVSSIKPKSFTVNSCISEMLLKIFSISWKIKKVKAYKVENHAYTLLYETEVVAWQSVCRPEFRSQYSHDSQACWCAFVTPGWRGSQVDPCRSLTGQPAQQNKWAPGSLREPVSKGKGSKIAQLEVVTRHSHLRSIPRTHGKGKNLSPQVVLWPPYAHTPHTQ